MVANSHQLYAHMAKDLVAFQKLDEQLKYLPTFLIIQKFI
jgi:hypothetical protein